MPTEPSLNDMMLFIAVIDAGSFTLAADRLMMPKANLSRKISHLENRLGITLLERTTRTQHITEAGQRYLTHCRRIQQELELADATIEQILNRVEGHLKVGASVGMGHEILKPVLGAFMHQYPKIKLQLNLLNRRVDLIEEGFDLVIRIGELNDSRLIAKRLGTVNRRLYASPSYLSRHDKIMSIEQLAIHDFLLMNRAQTNDIISITSGNIKHDINIDPKLIVDDYLILKQMTIDGLGVAIIPDYMCQQALKEGSLVALLPDWEMPPVDVYALYPKNRLNIPKVKVFMEYIQKIFQERLSNTH
ncbi:LysR family transcriptional regulator [Marinomonas sp. 2405UD68-3]|uniref:LysR family transcriptional regulator n=1 Tax=Marinomonas sp. 2405UD68-3 TaxID=3391835 RepID=UPI0039C9DBF1